MHIQKELQGFKISPAALWPDIDFSCGSFRRDDVFAGLIEGVLGPEHDSELTALHTNDEVYSLFRFYIKPAISFVETNRSLYPRTSYDANLLEYMRTFIVPYYGKHFFRRSVAIYQSPIEFPDNAILINGAYNGVPHPGWIESFAILKKNFSNNKIIVGMGTNFEIENVKHEIPVGNTQWRASLLAHTGMIDGIFAIRDSVFNFDGVYKYPERTDWSVEPTFRSERSYQQWWSSVYGRSSSRTPLAVVANGDTEFKRKSAFINPKKTQIFDLNKQHRLFGSFHSQKLQVWGGYSAEYVRKCWTRLRARYFQ